MKHSNLNKATQSPRAKRAARRARAAQRKAAALAGEAAQNAYPNGKWVTRAELYKILAYRKQRLNMPPCTSAGSMGGTLARKQVPYYLYGAAMRNKKYLLSAALAALSRRDDARQPSVRTGTEKDIASGMYIPLSTACTAFRCNARRLLSAVRNLDLLAVYHPITNRLWVDKEHARTIAEHRTAQFIRRVCTPEHAEYLLSTRPSTRSTKTSRRTVYWVPELSHLGSNNTSYK